MQGGENFRQRDIQLLGLVAIHIQINLRHIGAKGGINRRQLRALIGREQQRAQRGGQILRCPAGTVLQLVFEAARASQTGNGRRHKGENIGFAHLPELARQPAQHGVQLKRRLLARVPRLQDGDGQRRGGGGRTGKQGIATDRNHVGDGGILAHQAFNFIDHLGGSRQSRRIGQGNVHHDEALILGGQKARWQGDKAEIGGGNQAGEEHNHNKGAANQELHAAHVTAQQPIERAVEETDQKAVVVVRGLKQQHRQRRAEGQGIKLAGDPRHETHRDENRQQHQRGGDDRGGNLFHRRIGCLLRRQALGQLGLNVFHHDNGIIDHDADCQDQPEQGDQIDRKAQGRQGGKGADQRHRHGDGGDQGGPPIAKKNEDHRHHQADGDQQGPVDLVDRSLHKVGDVIEDGVLHVVGKTRRQFGQRGADQLGHVQRIGAGRLIDRQHRGRGGIELAIGRVVLRAQLDPGDIGQPHDRAVAVGPDDDPLELLLIGKAALGAQGILELLIRRGGRRPHLPGRDLHVLFLNGLDHIAHGHAQGGQLPRVEPHAHAVVQRAEDRRLAHTGQARQRVLDVDRGVVGKKQRIVGLFWRCQVDNQQHLGGLLLHGHPDALHILGQARGGDRRAVLRVDRRDIRVRSHLEGNAERHGAVVGAF